MFGVSEAFAMGGQPPAGGDQPNFLVQFFPFILMFVVIYLLILRPQYKKQKQQQAMIESLEKGDKIVTSGGIHGTIVGIKDKDGILMIQVAKDVRIEVSRGSVTRVAEEAKEGK